MAIVIESKYEMFATEIQLEGQRSKMFNVSFLYLFFLFAPSEFWKKKQKTVKSYVVKKRQSDSWW